MSQQSYNFITTLKKVNCFEIYDNIYNQHLATINYSDFCSYYNNALNNTLRFVSDLEELGYRLQKVINKFLNKEITTEKFENHTNCLYGEIGARFNHYFCAEDMPMVANVVEKIYQNARLEDCIYEYFTKHVLTYIQNKTKEQLAFEQSNGNTFDVALTNYITAV